EKEQRLAAETERERADAQARKATASQQQARRLLYASDMNLAQQSLKLNNLGRARRLLDGHRPQPGEEDLRGWEWRYLWQLTRSSALVTLTNRPVPGRDVSFSPDGTRLAVGWNDGRVDLWDVPGRRRIRALTDRALSHRGIVTFSPARNLLAATSEPNVVALYDLDSGRESLLWRAPDPGPWNVHDLVFSPDGSRVVIYAGSTREDDEAFWVVNVSSSQIESRHNQSLHMGSGRLSSDNRRLYLARRDASQYHYRIHCLDLVTGQELWKTERSRDSGLTALVLSPDGRVLASSSGFEDTSIRVWDAATGRSLLPLEGHTAFVWRLAFSRDGRYLISGGSDQSIRLWDAKNWKETQVLRGHTDEVGAVAISEPAQLVASAGKDGNLILWKEDTKSAADGYRRLPDDLGANQVLPLDQSHVLLLPLGKPPQLVDLKRDSPAVSLPKIGSAADVLGWFGTNILCQWNGTNQILVRELRGAEFIQRGAITLDSGTRPTGFAYNPTRQLLAWSEGSSSNSVYLESLAARGRRIELRSNVPGLVPFRFSDDGNYLAATKGWDSLRAWKVETGQIVASIGAYSHATLAVGGRVLVVAVNGNDDHEIAFYDLVHPNQPPRRVPGRNQSRGLAVSSDGGLVASSTNGGQVRLFDPAEGERIEDLHGHLNASFGIAFSADGRRLVSASTGGRESVKLWDVGTRQELLTLGGTGPPLGAARWSADGDVILAGTPWQAWRAPSWEEIAAAEAKEKMERKQP
ncbi:MAG: WD40 repeat domain-containing protein, partial [Verrucomicrobiales bacterium]|nr:WD40 repeat domain-containing protein [Verrucomicrobiales bacterium]